MLAQNVKGKEYKKRNGEWVQNVKGALAWTSVRRASKISSSRQEWDAVPKFTVTAAPGCTNPQNVIGLPYCKTIEDAK